MRTLTILAAALAVATASSAANAVVCYKVLDHSDHLLYQSSSPPVDMSDQGAASREDLRRRNEYLLVAEVDHCPDLATVPGTSGYRPATVDEIVAGMRSYLSYGGITGTSASGGGGSVAGAAGPAAASVRSGSTGTRSSY